MQHEAYASDLTALSFTGKKQLISNDLITGLYDFPAREYAPNQGRWISPDPAGLGAVDPGNPQSWNRYGYVFNNPMSATDPTGLFRWSDIFTAIADLFSNPFGAIGDFFGNPFGSGGGDLPPVCCTFQANSSASMDAIESGGTVVIPGAIYTTRAVPLAYEIRRSLQRAACGTFSGLVDAADPQNLNATVGVGVGGSAGVGFIVGASVSAGAQVVADRSGNLGVAFNFGGNPGYGVFGVGALAGGQIAGSGAPGIYDLRGSSMDFGGSIGAGPAVGGDVSAGGGNVTGTLTVGPGIGTKGAALGVDYTFVPSLLSTNCQ